MDKKTDYSFKIADNSHEFEEIYKLNYQTFVEEIQQHLKNNDEKLIDKFHCENTYVICKKHEKLIAMLAFRNKRPFSLDFKFKQINLNLDDFLPSADNVCEVRLLSINKNYRRTRVFYGLMNLAIEYALRKSFDLALISGILGQQKLYKNLGFIAFGPLVGNDEALFQPMYLDVATFRKRMIPIFRKTRTEK